jgi:hypothetical protein
VKPAPNPPTYKPNQSATTFAVGEESKPQPTTAAVGEENTGRPTTLAVGEEGNRTVYPSTNRLGEESGGGSRATTFAVGEESNPITRPTPSPTPIPNVSTRAVGEEGSRNSTQRSNSGNGLRNILRPWRNFRRW